MPITSVMLVTCQSCQLHQSRVSNVLAICWSRITCQSLVSLLVMSYSNMSGTCKLFLHTCHVLHVMCQTLHLSHVCLTCWSHWSRVSHISIVNHVDCVHVTCSRVVSVMSVTCQPRVTCHVSVVTCASHIMCHMCYVLVMSHVSITC